MLTPLLTTLFLLPLADAVGGWVPVGGPPNAGVIPVGNTVVVAPVEEPIAVVQMHPVSTPASAPVGELQAQPAGFRGTSDPAKRQGWFPRLFRGELWKKSEESQAEAPSVRDRMPSTLLESRPSEPASDGILLSRCRALLHQDQQLSGSTIQVHADRGILYLRGTVPSEVLRHRAEQIARKTDGAQEIVNELRVHMPDGNWFQHSAVTLSAPQTATGEPLPSPVVPPATALPMSTLQGFPANAPLGGQSPSFVANTAAPMAAMPQGSDDQFMIPPSPLAQGSTPKSTVEGTTGSLVAAVPATSQAWVPNAPTRPVAAPVQLGQPEVLTTRPGLPTVTTYLIRRAGEGSWDNGPAAPPAAVPETKPATLDAPSAEGQEEWVKPTARFVIPAPSMRGPTRTAKLDNATFQPASHATSGMTATPVNVASQRGLRPDVDAVLNADPAACGVNYRMDKGELVLFGEIPSANSLYDLAYRLNELPGVDLVSFERLRVRD
ncbi:MAG: BON domain-containing protein [Planctomycetota bacterium]